MRLRSDHHVDFLHQPYEAEFRKKLTRKVVLELKFSNWSRRQWRLRLGGPPGIRDTESDSYGRRNQSHGRAQRRQNHSAHGARSAGDFHPFKEDIVGQSTGSTAASRGHCFRSWKCSPRSRQARTGSGHPGGHRGGDLSPVLVSVDQAWSRFGPRWCDNSVFPSYGGSTGVDGWFSTSAETSELPINRPKPFKALEHPRHQEGAELGIRRSGYQSA